MDIIIVGAAMPFGPDTLKFKTLGGSETAQLMIGKALAKQGHRVVQVTTLPKMGEPDFIPPGVVAHDGVRYVPFEAYRDMVCTTPHDLLIISRDMRLANLPHQARHAVFWAHDLATYNFMLPTLQQIGWNIDEVWAVSEWHAEQIHKLIGYPRERIIAMRNGIVNVDDEAVVNPEWDRGPRDPKTLVYAARPERGLEALVREGGIMEQLPEFKLKVSMYGHAPDHMKPFYDWCWQRIEQLPNVEFMGNLKQPQMRREIAQAAAYVYPTAFEETSCILARECIETGTTMLTCREGALPETLGECGFFLEDFTINDFPNRYQKPKLEWNSDAFNRAFAAMVRWYLGPRGEGYKATREANMKARTDLYWDDVATAMVARVGVHTTKSVLSRAWSLVRDGDVIPAYAFLKAQTEELSAPAMHLMADIETYYGFLFDDSEDALGKHYAMVHDKLAAADSHFHRDAVDEVVQSQRWQAVAAQLAKLPPGSRVLDFGCAEGVQVIAWAKAFPQHLFVGVDFADMAISNAITHAQKHGAANVSFLTDKQFNDTQSETFDAAICTEVLEHQPKPWSLLARVEAYVRKGGPIILTTPYGEWETDQWEQFKRPWNRQHIWEIDSFAYNAMLAEKSRVETNLIPCNLMKDARARGHICVTYPADHKPIHEIDALAKALNHRPRETCSAVLIAKDAAKTIRNTLESIKHEVQMIRVVLDERTTDRTMQVVTEFHADNPWLYVEIIRGPAIEARKWGFDDARNLSIEDLDTDWFLWIDTDEYLSAPIAKFLRSNALDSYAIHQHHFTVDPRGTPAQIDRPARLCRSYLRFYGKVHEHAEKGFNGGPGYSMLIPDADIGHVGYVNEEVRRKRFERNWPFVEWDHEINPNRKLGPYLWFRDIIHRMRYAVEANNPPGAIALANEAVTFYNENLEGIMGFGMGAEAALAYLSEANRLLGRGRDVAVQMTLDGQPVQLRGLIEDERHILEPIRRMLAPELEKARSKYWG